MKVPFAIVALCCFLIPCFGLIGQATAQEAINFDSALQPDTGALILRQRLLYFKAHSDAMNRDIEQWITSTTIAYGVRDDLTLMFNAPIIFRTIDDKMKGVTHRDAGVGDLKAMAKYRVFRQDTGPTDTSRFDLIGGLEIRSGDSDFTSDSYNPIVGGVFTKSLDRHGFNADLLLKLNTGGDPNQLRYDLAYVYRLFPDQYAAGQLTAVFGVLELNGFYEDNGDDEVFVAPGVQYVTGRWALEASVQIPVLQELDHRPEKDFILGLSLRLRF